GVDAGLVDDAGVGLHERLRSELHPVQHREVLEALRREQADAAAAEQPIDHEGRLTQAASLLIIFEVDVLEAAERACLQVAPAVDQTYIELAFLATRVVHVLALRLHGSRAIATERREETAMAAEIEIARPAGAECGPDVHADQRELLVAPLRLVD